ncbi:MAG: imidazole glycerol phosphate synthase subunit HisH [Dehalococcoidia bacterium]|nr:imidazole glycerol phosphate synthase subunit HisH [Dehalococcoidia bacterium]
MIVVVDAGLGNIRSVVNKLTRLGVEVVASSSAVDIKRASSLVLPGVGAFDRGMTSLKRLGLDSVLRQRVVEEGVPILGICLGMQLFSKRSDEGTERGLGWIEAETCRLMPPGDSGLRVPHMGWNTVRQTGRGRLLEGIADDAEFYFVHSYYAHPSNEEHVAGVTSYGHEFASVIECRNVFATQFHPEKSHESGVMVLRNFVEMTSK